MGCCLGGLADAIAEKMKCEWLEKSWPSVEASLKLVLDAKDENDESAVLKTFPLSRRAEVILASGSLRVLSAKFLLGRPTGWAIQRLQDLPPEAFLDPKDAAMLFAFEGGLVVLSYGWLSKPHPDPDGFHLRTLLQYLAFHRTGNFSPLRDHGVFWDFSSLPQPKDKVDRTPEEKRTFGNGLKAINILYGAGSTTVAQLKEMPQIGKEGANLTAYDDRGWCFFEEVTSGILKKHRMFLNLALAKEEIKGPASVVGHGAVVTKAESRRRPAMHPDDFAVELKRRKFTNNADSDMVEEKYRQFMVEVAPTAKYLEWSAVQHHGHWGPEDMRILTRALPFFSQCEWLTLNFHPIGDEGATLLADELAKLPCLKKLEVFACRIWMTGREALMTASAGKEIDIIGLEIVLGSMPSQWANGRWCD